MTTQTENNSSESVHYSEEELLRHIKENYSDIYDTPSFCSFPKTPFSPVHRIKSSSACAVALVHPYRVALGVHPTIPVAGVVLVEEHEDDMRRTAGGDAWKFIVAHLL
jgi:hypothetical protein